MSSQPHLQQKSSYWAKENLYRFPVGLLPSVATLTIGIIARGRKNRYWNNILYETTSPDFASRPPSGRTVNHLRTSAFAPRGPYTGVFLFGAAGLHCAWASYNTC